MNSLDITGGRIANDKVVAVERASGGGIGAWDLSLKITGTAIQGNGATCSGAACVSEGGGISSSGFSVSLAGCAVSGNWVSGRDALGGGVSVAGESRFSSSRISDNRVLASNLGAGGGIQASVNTFEITTSTPTGNSVSAPTVRGGALDLVGGSMPETAIISGTTVKNNSLHAGSSALGGGISIQTPLTLSASSVESNSALGPDGFGGGIYSWGDGAPHDLDIMKASKIRYNFASTTGGGISQAQDPPSIISKSANSVPSGNLPNNSVPPLP